MSRSIWRPLWTGETAARAAEAVAAVAAAIPSVPPAGTGAWSASLASGRAGQALLYAYLSFDPILPVPSAAPAERAITLLDAAFDTAAAEPMSDGLYTGFPGVAWASEHLAGRLFSTELEAGDDVDEAIALGVSQSPWRGEIDLVNGLVGQGLYLLERLPAPRAVQGLEQIVRRLGERAEPMPSDAQVSGRAAAWFTPAEALPEHLRAAYPQGLYNLGISHGIAGILALLGAACAAGIATATARPLLEAAVPWLLARRLAPGRGASFDHYHHPDVAASPSRLAWCYGDLGIAAALHVAARGTGRDDWERKAVAIAAGAAVRTEESSGVRDAGLCHGAAGVGHLFNRLWQATGDARLRTAADRWLNRALALREPGRGVGGFRAWSLDAAGTLAWRDDPGLLEGAAGVALALLAAVSTVEPEWDRMLGVSLRPSAAPRSGRGAP